MSWAATSTSIQFGSTDSTYEAVNLGGAILAGDVSLRMMEVEELIRRSTWPPQLQPSKPLRIATDRNGVTFHSFGEFRRPSEVLEEECPEIYDVIIELRRGGRASSAGEGWLKELSEAMGWSREDVEEDLRHIDTNPSERVEKYRGLLRKYSDEASNLKGRGNRQAAEKIWGRYG